MNDANKTNSGSGFSSMTFGEREWRLGAGLVMLVFLTTHLLNHALGALAMPAMEYFQTWRIWVWRSWPGTIILYGAMIVHITLALKRIVLRRTWRMPFREAAQIILALFIPYLAYEHLIGTRYVASFADVNDVYRATLYHLWPHNRLTQIGLVLAAWGHGMIGLNYFIRTRTWYPRWRTPILIAATTIPLMAVSGFIAAGRESRAMRSSQAFWTQEQIEAFFQATKIAQMSIYALGAVLITLIIVLEIWRRFKKSITIRYVGHGEIKIKPGLSVLEASRSHDIPHPSLCGGRGRCSTCRVQVTAGLDDLPPPQATEQVILTRMLAPKGVRLACQLRPVKDLSVQILLPKEIAEGQPGWEDAAYKQGIHVEATVICVNLRGIGPLTRSQLPYDLVALLNRFSSEMYQAIKAHGGQSTMHRSDNLTAVFGFSLGKKNGSRKAIATARAMLKTIKLLNEEFALALPVPLRIGIGIHSGSLILASIGDPEQGPAMVALGDTVTIAEHIREATNEYLADCFISQETLDIAGRSFSTGSSRQINHPERSEPITVYSLSLDDTREEGEEK